MCGVRQCLAAAGVSCGLGVSSLAVTAAVTAAVAAAAGVRCGVGAIILAVAAAAGVAAPGGVGGLGSGCLLPASFGGGLQPVQLVASVCSQGQGLSDQLGGVALDASHDSVNFDGRINAVKVPSVDLGKLDLTT